MRKPPELRCRSVFLHEDEAARREAFAERAAALWALLEEEGQTPSAPEEEP